MIFRFTSLVETLRNCEDEDAKSTPAASRGDRKELKKLHKRLCVRADDDCSLTSEATTSSTSSSSSCSTTTSKAVRFNEDLNQVYENTQWCWEDSLELWHSAQDYHAFKCHTSALAREVTKAEARNRAPFSYERVLLRTFDVCRNVVLEPETGGSVLSQEDRKHLKRWAEKAPTRLGLEKWAVRQIGWERMVRRAEILDAVLTLQEETTADEVATTSDDSVDRSECIRQSAERISRPSRLFARSMAEAQAAALEGDNFFSC